MQITLTIRGQNGSGSATFPLSKWKGMCPVSKVLAIHEQRRDITAGQPFEIITKTKTAETAKGDDHDSRI